MASTIFLSYSSPQASLATRIELALVAEGHTVFRDRSSLPAGESFDAQIRSAIAESDLLVFLISADSVTAGRYTLTELKFAQQRWRHPARFVLPVLVDSTPISAIPEYLRAVTMFRASGDIGAEVAAEVDRMLKRGWRSFLTPRVGAALVAGLLLVALGAWQIRSVVIERREQAAALREQAVQVAAVVKQAQLQSDSSNYADAWATLERARATYSAAPDLVDAQERLAMKWLDDARGSDRTLSLKQIADKVYPVLTHGAVSGSGERAADLLAHMGWADFLRSREGVGGLNPAAQYRRALEVDPNNVFAHTMLGFDVMRSGGSIADARTHFARALMSPRHREYVRHMQIAAMLWSRDDEAEEEAIRIANDIRTAGEPMPPDSAIQSDRWRLWNVYDSRLINLRERDRFLRALAPADHLATYTWLYPVQTFPKGKSLYYFVLAQLQEGNGDRSAAMQAYQAVVSDFEAQGVRSGNRLLEHAQRELKQQGKSN